MLGIFENMRKILEKITIENMDEMVKLFFRITAIWDHQGVATMELRAFVSACLSYVD